MTEPARLWRIRLNGSVRARHLLVLYFAGFLTILMAVGVNTLQPYLLSTFLDLHVSQHGDASGAVLTVGEFVAFVLVGIWGALSDRAGRRFVYVTGFLIMGASMLAMPMSHSLGGLFGARALYSVGVAATTGMLTIIAADYIVNEDRGKGNAALGVANGLGAGLGAVLLSRLPLAFQNSGQDPIAAGWYTYSCLAGICVLGAVVVRLGLVGGAERPTAAEEPPPLLVAMRDGLATARTDAVVAMSYAAAFVARADLAIAGVFLPLWLTRHSYGELPEATRRMAEQSLCAAEAMAGDAEVQRACVAVGEAAAEGVKAGGALIGVIGAAGLVAAPLIGLLCDRINRSVALGIALLINVIGYGMTGLIDDPTAGMVWGIVAVIGAGEACGVITSQVLIQQIAPAERRGAVVGMFNVFGALGIMICLFVGGKLFDHWTESGPFVFVAVLNLFVAGWALLIRGRVEHRAR